MGNHIELENNEVYDEVDIASALEMGFVAQSISAITEKNKPEKHPNFDGVHCIDCEESIEKERLALGKIRCFECQNILDKYNKQYGR